MTGRIFIVCSDRARNGKTMLARLFVDMLQLGGLMPLVFDTDAPEGGLARHFPLDARIVDLQRTTDQLALFDTVLADTLRDTVIDLSARDLDTFFDLCATTGFDEAAHAAGRTVRVFYILDRAFHSVVTAARLRRLVQRGSFILIRNEAIAPQRDAAYPESEVRAVNADRIVTIPELTDATMRDIESTAFSWKEFVLRGHKFTPVLRRHELFRIIEAAWGDREIAARD